MDIVKRKGNIIIFAAAALLALLMLLAAGCGEEEASQNGTIQCKTDDPSIIPAPSGKPQHVYFYSPT